MLNQGSEVVHWIYCVISRTTIFRCMHRITAQHRSRGQITRYNLHPLFIIVSCKVSKAGAEFYLECWSDCRIAERTPFSELYQQRWSLRCVEGTRHARSTPAVFQAARWVQWEKYVLIYNANVVREPQRVTVKKNIMRNLFTVLHT